MYVFNQILKRRGDIREIDVHICIRSQHKNADSSSSRS